MGIRTVALDQPRQSPWGDIGIETFRDNIASKMTALVERGAPRDFQDIHAVCSKEIITPETCWKYYQQKNPRKNLKEEQAKVLTHLGEIELRRPLTAIKQIEERELAQKIRHWFKTVLCNTHGIARQMGL
jgi:hypothetical protein